MNAEIVTSLTAAFGAAYRDLTPEAKDVLHADVEEVRRTEHIATHLVAVYTLKARLGDANLATYVLSLQKGRPPCAS